jgi:hypothetical protein
MGMEAGYNGRLRDICPCCVGQCSEKRESADFEVLVQALNNISIAPKRGGF